MFVDVNLMFALAYAFRHIGKAIAVILLIVQIPGSSGMFPIEMMPDFFQVIHPLLPFTYSIDAMREAIGGFYAMDYLHDMLLLGLLFVPLGFAIGLGIGGIGVWAALFHVFCHTLVKSSLFLQMAVVRQVYDSYRINRIGDYIHINRVGAVGLLTGMVVLVAFPPSPLFLSELMILKQTIADGRWWLVTGIMLLLCLVIYFFCSRLLRLCYQPRQDELHPSATDRALSWSALSLLAAAIGLGLWQPAFFRELIDRIASL